MSKNLKINNLDVNIYDNSLAMGNAAATFVTTVLRAAIASKNAATMILATGASQFSFLDALGEQQIDWQKVTIFHLDEYKGISIDHPASFRKYLKDRILDRINPKHVYFLNGDAADLESEIIRYTKLLKEHQIDLACIGIGENGHIAFNDPHVADFNDPHWVKLVSLDETCRMQQLGEGWFPSIEEVPEQALTLTIPAILSAKTISCVVPDERKAQAVHNTLYGEISTSCPASILRTHSSTKLFLDNGSAPEEVKTRS